VKVLVCGSRSWEGDASIRKALEGFPPTSTVICGGCRGADTIAATVAEELGMTVVTVSADWCAYGKAAGPIRNQRMLDMDPDVVLAFHPDMETSRGTADMVRRARRKGTEVRLYSR
jgi:hypothetical protein